MSKLEIYRVGTMVKVADEVTYPQLKAYTHPEEMKELVPFGETRKVERVLYDIITDPFADVWYELEDCRVLIHKSMLSDASVELWDDIYLGLLARVINEGVPQDDIESVRAVYADGTKATTKSIEGVHFIITPEMGVPLLSSKFVGRKTPLLELEWIWQELSNDVTWLEDRNVKIWSEWKNSAGNLGTAYGYQMANKRRLVKGVDGEDLWLNQVEYVLHQLKNNPSSRRIMTSLWGVDDLDSMTLEPCVWATHWTVHGGKLNLHVKQRSGDSALGIPYNILQYSVLHSYIAKFVGIEKGNMYWNVDNFHIYERHIPEATKQIDDYVLHTETHGRFEPLELTFPDNWDTENFFNNRLSEAVIEGYEHLGKRKFEIAI